MPDSARRMPHESRRPGVAWGRLARRYGACLGGCLLAVALALAVHAQRAEAATYTVGTTTDAGAATAAQCLDPNNTACRLRDAIGYAIGGADTVQFNFGGRGTIHLMYGTLYLSASMTIAGPTSGAGGVTVDGGHAVQVFVVPGGVTAGISDLTIANGQSASGTGGGIFINSGGTLTVTNSTLSGNTAPGNSGSGGGIYNQDGTLTVTNSTLSGNSALSSRTGGGIYNFYANFVTLTVTNTIVAGNTASSAPDIYGPIASGGHNLIGNATGATGLVASDKRNVAPLLGAFGNYGGPTQTFPLLPGSPAIDAGDDPTCAQAGTTDQRGIARPQGAHCDIGAFESQGFALAKTSGDNQSAIANGRFATPLAVAVTSSHGEPVVGGQVTFTAPGSGPSATFSSATATIAGGAASVTATANATPGAYTVTAQAPGAAPVSFALANNGVAAIGPASGGVAGGGAVTLTGAGFGTAATTQVLVDGVALPAGSIVSVTGTQIVYRAPAHAAGDVAVTVKVGGTPLPGSATYTYGVVSALPGNEPNGGTGGGSPSTLPGARPGGPTGGTAPAPLPTGRP